MSKSTKPQIPSTELEAAPPERKGRGKKGKGDFTSPTLFERLKGGPGPRSGWANTATEELENFRKVPLVGNLPWKAQYALATFGLLACLVLTMVFVSLQPKGSGGNSTRAQLAGIGQQIVALSQQAVAGSPPSAPQIDGLIAQGANLGGKQPEWVKMEEAAKLVKASAAEAAGVTAAARKVAGMRQGLSAVTPLWRRAGEAGEWTTTSAVNLAQVLAQMQTMAATAEGVVLRQEAIGGDFASQRQSLEQSFRVFSASPEASQNALLTQAWREAARAFVQARPSAEALSSRAVAWDNLIKGMRAAQEAQLQLAAPLGSTGQSGTDYSWALRAAWFSAFGALLFLLLLLWVGWKQQRWHQLSARAAQELVEREAQEIMRGVQGVEHGDLVTRIPVSSHVLGTLGDSLNRTVAALRKMVERVRENADSTTLSVNAAVSATGSLAEGMQEQLTHLVDTGEVILEVSRHSQLVAGQAEAALDTAHQTQELTQSGLEASAGSREHIQQIRRRNEDAADRAERLKTSSREIAGIADVINDIAEQTEVLAAQASLQANKAGEHGRGFLVVAAGVRDLAERSGEYARRVNARIETALADLEKVSEACAAALSASDEGARLADISQETWLSTDARLAALRKQLIELRETVEEQDQKVQTLGDSTGNALQQVEQQRQQAHGARQSVSELLESAGTLRESVSMFRI